MTLLGRILPGIAAYPDVHPMLVHFPAALFPVALFFAALAVWRYPDLIGTSRALVLLGTLSAFAAVASGLIAEDMMAHGAGSIVASHKTFMLTTAALATVLSVFVITQWRSRSATGRWVHLVALLVLNAVLILGADRGAVVAIRLRSGLDLKLPPTATPTRVSDAAEADTARGRALYAVLRCAECHGPKRAIEAPGVPPTLEYAGSKMQTEWMKDYLLHPHRIRWADDEIRPVVRMPDYDLEDGEARNIAAHLATFKAPERFPAAPVEEPSPTREEADSGRVLIGQYACKGCHMIGGTGNEVGPDLSSVGNRLQPAFLFAFLRDPRGIIPGTSMKNFHLDVAEARRLTAYLMTLRAASARADSSRADRDP